jgi:hypothetical protein
MSDYTNEKRRQFVDLIRADCGIPLSLAWHDRVVAKLASNADLQRALNQMSDRDIERFATGSADVQYRIRRKYGILAEVQAHVRRALDTETPNR